MNVNKYLIIGIGGLVCLLNWFGDWFFRTHSLVLFPNWLSFESTFTTFMGLSGGKAFLLLIAALALWLGSLYLLRKERLEVVFGLLLGTVVGNGVSLVVNGYVNDFIRINNLYLINLADLAGFIGLLLLAYIEIVQRCFLLRIYYEFGLHKRVDLAEWSHQKIYVKYPYWRYINWAVFIILILLGKALIGYKAIIFNLPL